MSQCKSDDGFSTFGNLLLLFVVAVVAFVGFLTFKARQNDTDAVKNANSSAIKEEDVGPEAAEYSTKNPYEDWKEYCSANENSCFRYPANWVQKSGTDNPDEEAVTLTSPSDTVLTFRSGMDGLGGGCDSGIEPHVIYDEVARLDGAPDLYYVKTHGEAAEGEYNMGLVQKIYDKPPTKGDTGACLKYLVFKSRRNAALYSKFSTALTVWGNTKSFMHASDLDTVELILKSYMYK